jgi:hypothetical protein
MSPGPVVILLLALPILGSILILLIGWLANQRRSSLALQDCPICGAENHSSSLFCYCCGQILIPICAAETEVPVIERVNQADVGKLRRQISAGQRISTRGENK